MAGPAIVLLFGLSCPSPCSLSGAEKAGIERLVISELSEKGLSVRPAEDKERRPTGTTASVEPTDEAQGYGVDRVVALDLEAGEKIMWVTHFLRGTTGTWSVGKSACGRGEGEDEAKADPKAKPKPKLEPFVCPGLIAAVSTGLRPRKGEDVDFTSALRAHSKIVGACIAEEDQVAPAERVYGRVELELEAHPNGEVRVKSIAPAVVAKSKLGTCLKKGMERMYVGPYEGQPIKLRVPIDL